MPTKEFSSTHCDSEPRRRHWSPVRSPNRRILYRNSHSTVTLGGSSVKFKLDTGAEANVLPLSVYSELQHKSPLMDTSVVLSSYGDFKVKPEGKVTLACEAQGLK